MRRLLVIGIGAGDPEHVTVQAINALNEVDVFFVVEKSHETDELVRLRREICERYIREPTYRIVEIQIRRATARRRRTARRSRSGALGAQSCGSARSPTSSARTAAARSSSGAIRRCTTVRSRCSIRSSRAARWRSSTR